MQLQQELLTRAKSKYTLSQRVCDAFMAVPRHEFLHRFSPDYTNWLEATPEQYPLIYADTTLLLYENEGFISTISQPSFVLEMLQMLDLRPGMKVFELGTGSGWNAALMGHLVGKEGKVISYEIIPEMVLEARNNIAKFDLPQVKVVQGDALVELWSENEFNRGIFTAGAWDMPGILFDVMKVGGKFLFVLKTRSGDLLLALKREEDHFRVYDSLPCQFVTVTGDALKIYHNDLSRLYSCGNDITIWPQGTMGLTGELIPGRDMIFKIG